jgi:hypothetical protein
MRNLGDSTGRNLSGSTGARAARIRRTGLALVHEGELVLPAAGSEAAAELVARDDRVTVNYYFPVEIEVSAAGEPADPRPAVEHALRSFARGIDNLV